MSAQSSYILQSRCVLSPFAVSIDSFHSNLTALELDTFCNDYGIESEFDPELPGPNDTIKDFPAGKIAIGLPIGLITFEKRRKKKNTTITTCHTNPFDSLKGWREEFFWVNALVALITMLWFSGKEFLRDSTVDAVDEDMVLETLLNDVRNREKTPSLLI
ncbi:hypothetical protein Tco_0699772 [Tanacetum coccineum]